MVYFVVCESEHARSFGREQSEDLKASTKLSVVQRFIGMVCEANRFMPKKRIKNTSSFEILRNHQMILEFIYQFQRLPSVLSKEENLTTLNVTIKHLQHTEYASLSKVLQILVYNLFNCRQRLHNHKYTRSVHRDK